MQLLSTFPRNHLYAGHELFNLETGFVAGDGIILSTDLVKLIIDRVTEVDSGVIDDVAIGRFLRKNGVTPRHVPRPIVQSLFDCNNIEIYEKKYHQVRCKVERKILGRAYRLDPQLMKVLYGNFERFRGGF